MIKKLNKVSQVLIGAIDQSTTATKFTLFNKEGETVHHSSREHKQISEQPGHLQHNPNEIIENLNIVIDESIQYLLDNEIDPSCIQAVGITNQRETVVAFDRQTNKVYHDAIVWCDQRTKAICEEMINKNNGNKNHFKQITGLPISTYFSAFKMKWLIENNKEIKENLDNVSFGTIDSFLLNYLTGNFFTDVSNASRSFLMDIKKVEYSGCLLDVFELKRKNLAEIKPSVYDFGEIKETRLSKYGIKVMAILGDQHSACLGHGNIEKKEVKHTYGTGCFMMTNIGEERIITEEGLLTSVLFQLGEGKEVQYALEGAIETGAQNINWLSNNLGIFDTFDQMDQMLNETKDQKDNGVYFVPAFGGLYSPYFENNTTGVMVGLSHNARQCHLVRAVVEAICYRTQDVIEVMEKTVGYDIPVLKVDGGITMNTLIMQMQSDILQKDISKTKITDSTAFGVAFAAGLGSGLYKDVKEIKALVQPERVYTPDKAKAIDVQYNLIKWKKAINKSIDW